MVANDVCPVQANTRKDIPANSVCGDDTISQRVICHPSTSFGNSGSLLTLQQLAVQGCWGVAEAACDSGAL